MIEGVRCPPGTHKYRAHGKVLFCTACGDVQPLLLDVEEPPTRTPSIEPEPPVAFDEQPEPTAAELDAHIARLRQAAGLAEIEAEREATGQRGTWAGDLTELEPDIPRRRVDEGYNIDPREDRLPSAGL